MEQRTHAWIAVRALALLEDKGSHPKLVQLLRPCARHAAIGAWIPDLTDIKRGGGGTQHHVLKMLPYTGPGEARFVATKSQLVNRLACSPAAKKYLRDDQTLNDEARGPPPSLTAFNAFQSRTLRVCVFTAG